MRSLMLTAAVMIVSQDFVHVDGGCCKPGGCCVPSDRVPLVCRPVWKTVPVVKACFDVECEEICIPKVTLPWQKCQSRPKCGKVIAVNTLTIREFECGETFVCVWHVEPACCAGVCKPDCSQPQRDRIPPSMPLAPPADSPALPPPPADGTVQSPILRLY